MLKKSDNDLIVGLDIGTTKIVALVGEVNDEGKIEVIGVGKHPSKGLKRGVVVNIDATVNSIRRALEEAELMAGCEIKSAFTGIAGNHIRSLNSHGIVAVRDNEVCQADVDRVIDAAKAVAIPADQRILHILPQEFMIDSQEDIREPIGMSGVRLEARVHIVTGAVSAAQNIAKCVQACGIQVGDIVLEQLASSHSVLTEDEKELGVCMIDIGGGTTDIAVFTNGSIRHTAVIPIAGDQVTNDVAVALRTPTKFAEELKVKHGCALPNSLSRGEMIDVPTVVSKEPRQLSRVSLAEVIGPRYEELFMLIRSELRRNGLEDLVPAGIVLTGGASQVQGAAELAEQVFGMPVRAGLPQHIEGLKDVRETPIYATGVGLLLHGMQQRENPIASLDVSGGLKGILSRMKDWFHGNF